jgi:RimJ/RimL family protein N-acetyltransferase
MSLRSRKAERVSGMFTRAAAAVAADLVRLGIETIALNVAENNAATTSVNERLGFKRYSIYREGIAIRK